MTCQINPAVGAFRIGDACNGTLKQQRSSSQVKGLEKNEEGQPGTVLATGREADSKLALQEFCQ